MNKSKKHAVYTMPVILLLAICSGGLTGYFFGNATVYLKPLGDLFLRLIFTVMVPLIFFSVSAAIANVGSISKLGRILFSMLLVFLFTGLIAGIYSVLVVSLFPPAQNAAIHLVMPEHIPTMNFLDQVADIFTVPEFSKLLSHQHILALIVFSMLVGIATLGRDEKMQPFVAFLKAGDAVFMGVFHLIMYFAPIGFFAYFATMVHELGPQLLTSYVRITELYYVAAIVYFLFFYSCYAYFAGRGQGLRLFWSNIFLPLVTSIATCSSAASIPANLLATKKMRVAPEIYETVIPLGTVIHKDGSVIGGIFKIAFLFGIFNLPFASLPVIITAVGVGLLVGTVMGAIPSGGMLGELLILHIYGFPPSVLLVVAAFSLLIDPIATMLNVTGNSVSSMMIARLVDGKNWLTRTA